MHEVAIGERIVLAALEELEGMASKPQTVSSIRVVMGGLHQVVPEYLQSAYAALTAGTLLDGSRLRLKVLPVKVQCRQCGWNGAIQPPVFACRDCGEFHVDVVQGRELYLDQMEVSDDVTQRD